MRKATPRATRLEGPRGGAQVGSLGGARPLLSLPGAQAVWRELVGRGRESPLGASCSRSFLGWFPSVCID